MKRKPNILVFIDWFWPGHLAGGPVQSMVSLVQYLGNDVNFKIVTTNRDLNSPRPYENIETGKWLRSPLGCDIYYAEPASLSAEFIGSMLKSVDHDKVYINSFYSRYFSVVPLHLIKKNPGSKPVILAPRGMLSPGALAIKSLKKRLFILYARLTGLHKRVIWHATSEQERKEITKAFGAGRNISVISNLPKKMGPVPAKPKQKGSLNLCFVSRISTIKNLEFALEVLAEQKEAEIRLNIYGPLEDQVYWQRCQERIAKMPANVKVVHKGSVNPAKLEAALAGEHVLLLPTRNENFGHAIVECLLAGCPAVISDQTPWKDLQEHNAGYALALSNKQKFIDAITRYAAMGQEEFANASAAANNYIREKINLDRILNQYIELFNAEPKN